MAQPFLKLVADHIYEHYKDTVEKLCIVLPGKRGALFLKHHLSRSFGKTLWLPAIISAEELIAELSGLKTLEEIDLICHLYESYKACYGGKAEPFESFAKWGQLILQDFNEIDRYLADPEQLYENLKDIRVIENWSLGEEQLSEYQQNYLAFMNSLGAIYKHFSAFLLSQEWAYQGLAYRQAVLNLSRSDYPDRFHKLLFCGFNALNAAEQKIFQTLHAQKKAEILWDADRYYLDDESQEAGLFLRRNLRLFGQREPSFIQDNFKEAKEISLISVPKQMGQAQVVKQVLQRLIDEQVPLDRVALVLANEKLLAPVLQQLPAAVEQVNITMEYPLRYTSTYGLIDLLLQIQLGFARQNRAQKTIYHKDLVALLRQPLFRHYLRGKGLDVNSSYTVNQINTRNLSFISPTHLHELLGTNYVPLQPLLQPAPSVSHLCDAIVGMLETCIAFFAMQPRSSQNSLELEYLHIVFRNFNRLTELLDRYPHFHDINAFRQLYNQVVGTASAPFIGEPLRGLQIMGLLETRTLDFEHVILVNVNEGVLPAGKSINSFLPNDLKRAFSLPLYLEKDAIYAYHFYRLIQRAKEIVITCDSETDTFGKGEKSRFVTQLQLEMPVYSPGTVIREEIASYDVFPEELDNTIRIPKTEEVLQPLWKKASSNEPYGALSPSALTLFKDCSLKFYYRYSAGLKELKEVEESAEANTFGSILHLSLESLYKQFTGKVVNAGDLEEQLKHIDSVVNESFISFFDRQPPMGKSLLQQEVIKVYVTKLVKNDLRFIRQLKEKNQFLTLKALEQEFTAPLDVQINGKTETVHIRGTMDRLDQCGDMVRIIDYKSSVKDSDKFIFEGFDKLFSDKNYNKQFQLFMYAWLLFRNNYCEASRLRPCIVPFKVFAEEPRFILGSDKQPLVFNEALLLDFEAALKEFTAAIFAKEGAFVQTDDTLICAYCPYNAICNIPVD